jgi:hypothetical protein
MQEEHALPSQDFDDFGADQVRFGDDFDEDPDEAAGDPLIDARLFEMLDALEALRDSEVSDALRRLRQLFPHIPFPFRVRALMAARHRIVLG